MKIKRKSGYTDINGKDICDGDYVKYRPFYPASDSNYEIIELVAFNEKLLTKQWRLLYSDLSESSDAEFVYNQTMEVIPRPEDSEFPEESEPLTVEEIEKIRIKLDKMMKVEFDKESKITAYWIMLDKAKDALGSIALLNKEYD